MVNEGALRQQVGGPDVLRAQLRHLADVVERHPDTVPALSREESLAAIRRAETEL